MKNLKFKLDSSEKDFDEVFFNRPISRLHASWVGIVTSQGTPIKTISSLYQIIDTLGHNVCLVADEKQSGGVLPADVLLKNKSTPGYENADEAILALKNCKIIIFISAKELNSSMELLMNKLTSVYSGLLITNRESVFTNTDFVGDAIQVADNRRIRADYNAGLSHVAEVTMNYSKEINRPIVFIGETQILSANHENPNEACVINTKQRFAPEEYLGFLAGLMADKKIPLDQDWLRYCQASGFLLRKMQSEGLDSVKKYLNDKF